MTDCTIWTGGRSMGYGEIAQYPGSPIRAHRWVYLAFVGPIPKKHHIHHLCHNKLCVNPDHLELVKNTEHGHRHRKTRCQRGHEFTPENVYIRPDTGHRICAICAQLRHKAAYDYVSVRQIRICEQCEGVFLGNAGCRFCSNRCRSRAGYLRRRDVA